MGADVQQHLTGRKGGSSKPKQPSIARDSLQSVATAKLLLAVGEGEFAEGPSDQDIYLDNTPLMDASGNVNFPNVKWEWRSGSVDQDYIPGIPSVENETTVNVELRSDTPWVRSVTNTQLSAVRLRFAWPALQKQESSGDVNGYRIEYAVDVSTDGGAYQQVLLDAVDGKTTSRYERSQRIDLPAATTGWQVRVRRLTPNQNSSLIADTMLIAGLTEVIDAKLRYPNTALLYIEFSAEQFSNIPAVTVECKARKVQVPTTYDPELRTYTGVWDGSFKSAWTNNPAWITYDISTNARFGLGKRIKPWMVDKWELYKIAQYCDQLVPDGKGGQEPRFLCDLNLQSRSQAWTLLRDIAAIYRGMSYWAQGQLVSQADMPRTADFDYVFTRANVIDGKMTYGAASARTRYSRALVSYDNPANNYDTDVTGYSDAPLLRRYGDNPVELSAIGCTRESEAQRRGKWAVLTSVQDRTITFATGMEGRIPLPGYIIPVADSLLAGREIGGRISAVAGRVVTLDRVTQAKAGDRLIINLPSGRAEGRTVQSVNGKAVTVTAAYSEAPEPELCWALDADDLAVQLYRVMSTKRDDNGQWTINGLQYEPSKFDHIDTGARLEERPISIIPVTTVQPPASVTLSSRWTIDQGLAVSTMTITWPAVEGAVAYDVEWKKDSGNWIRLPRAGTTSVDVTSIYAGGYLARVRAVSAFDITSVWKSSILTQLSGKTGAPPALAFLRTTSGPWKIGLEWGFPVSGAADTAYTEIQQSVTPGGSEQNATALGLFAYPTDTHTLTSLAAGARLAFRGRLIDRTGNVGPWSAWVDGISSTDASEYNELITKEYVESALGEQFFADIDQMQVDISGLQVDISGLQGQIDNLSDVLAYDPTKTYAKNDIVRVGNRLYQAKQAVPLNASPPNASYWADIGQSIETANGLAQQVATNTADITELDGKVEAAASSLDVLQAAARREPATGEKADALKGWDTIARAATEVTVRANADEAQAKRTSLLEARTVTAEGRIATVESVVASNNAVTVQRLDQLSGQVASNASAISTEQTVRANADSALGQRVDTVSARTDTNEANIQTTSQAVTSLDGNVKALYSVKLQAHANGQKYAAGWQLGFDSGTSVTTMAFQADRFLWFNSSSGQTVAPVSIVGGQMFINNAMIQDGSINNAKIGNVIQSNNYVAGQTGWRIDKAGQFEINGAIAGQGRLTISSNAIKVYDGQGRLRVHIGDLSA
ncbi:phage tail protein [Pseudomonas aeruginosa]|uniref:phage tail protein n=1 Tax=Pseudomonas aeruginosa TaxID=287 RepID=UPI000D73BC96|nr:phage tail protein [Pseudomonas aeruginosa]PXA58384.1 phage tail protein [Pseudomonas aeruginosa]